MTKQIQGKKVLVTGGAGFIGSGLIESLLESGNQVTCLDNFLTGKHENVVAFMNNGNFRMIEGDIRDTETCRKATAGMDIVFHEAALGSVPRSVVDPVTTVDINIGGFVKMLFASKEAGVKRFIYAASSSVYGDNQRMPKIEEETGRQLSPYAVSKYANELFAENFSSVYGIEVVGLRYFNVFGRRQDPEGPYAAVIPKFLKSLKLHRQPVINGNGTISRDFTYIDNVIQANHLAATTENRAALNSVYNIACGERMTLTRAFELTREYSGKYDRSVLAIEPIYGPDRAGDIQHSQASIEKARTNLGYVPLFDAENGLKETVDWFWKNM
ncbi:MAG TPA: SDR family oxidoreductase [Bacteroidales bacterium]|nr:SDR family oxidoreductase [Bacteroidales bacterium]